MPHPEAFVALLAGIALLAGLARFASIPEPVVLVLGGLAAGLVPGLRTLNLSPDLVFYGFLPPLVYAAAVLYPTGEVRANARAIGFLATGLVFATMVGVAVVAHYVVGLGWAPAFVLGAILAPTDPVAATSVASRLGAPQRMQAILAGEALFNDGTGLVSFKVAVAAVGAASPSLGSVAGKFALASAGGIAVGVAAGWLAARLRSRLDEARIEITIAVVTAYAAYVAADVLGLSGVLAAVAAGLYAGRSAPRVLSATTRIESEAFWGMTTFLLESALFLLMGIAFPRVLAAIDRSAGTLILDAAAVVGALWALRVVWMFTMPYVARLLDRRGESFWLPGRQRAVIAWGGMRGAVSVAAALSIPLSTSVGPFPDRDLVVFVAYASVLVTLVVPGLTLTPLLRALGLAQDEARRAREVETRRRLAHAALGRLEQIAQREDPPPERSLGLARERYELRLRRLTADADNDGSADGAEDAAAYRELLREAIAAEREELAEIRGARAVDPDTVRAVRRELDLDESRLR